MITSSSVFICTSPAFGSYSPTVPVIAMSLPPENNYTTLFSLFGTAFVSVSAKVPAMTCSRQFRRFVVNFLESLVVRFFRPVRSRTTGPLLGK